jgi:hypothetical protein
VVKVFAKDSLSAAKVRVTVQDVGMPKKVDFGLGVLVRFGISALEKPHLISFFDFVGRLGVPALSAFLRSLHQLLLYHGAVDVIFSSPSRSVICRTLATRGTPPSGLQLPASAIFSCRIASALRFTST